MDIRLLALFLGTGGVLSFAVGRATEATPWGHRVAASLQQACSLPKRCHPNTIQRQESDDGGRTWKDVGSIHYACTSINNEGCPTGYECSIADASTPSPKGKKNVVVYFCVCAKAGVPVELVKGCNNHMQSDVVLNCIDNGKECKKPAGCNASSETSAISESERILMEGCCCNEN
jgi:hypothetical protein